MTGDRSRLSTFEAHLELVPEEPGVYLMRDSSGSIIYVGKANSLRQRLRSYFTPNPSVTPRIQAMISKIASFDTILCENEIEALILESNLIKKYQPKYNILMRDDKEYPYIRVTMQEPYPRVTKAFRLGPDADEGARYFGPWLAGDVNRALKTLSELFPLRRCNRDLPDDIGKRRPCLNMDIGRCLAPCDDRISQEDYRELAEQVCLFLEGKTDDITKKVYDDMRAASDQLDFEEAECLKHKWMSLKALRETQRVVDPSGGDRDVLALARNGREVAMVRLDIRDGRMTGCARAFAEDTEETDGAYLSAMIREQYRSASIPAEIIVASPLEDQDVLTQWLRKKRGRAVRIHFPQRGDKKALIDMARHNAEKSLERRALARGADTRSLRETLMTLADLCHLERVPERIEAYDISNWGKDIRSASMVVFRNGKPERSSYRHFKIKAFEGIDDYRAMAEVIKRRVDRLKDETFGDRPDLILVDGGKGHVSAVRPILEHVGIPVAGMVKDQRHRTRGLVKPTGEILELSNPESIADAQARSEEERAMRQGLLHLLTSIQDEAHRFAQRLNKKERRRRVMRYTLENIKGVGPARRRLLLEAFGTSKQVEEASLEQLKAVKGLPEDVAESIFHYFHQDLWKDDDQNRNGSDLEDTLSESEPGIDNNPLQVEAGSDNTSSNIGFSTVCIPSKAGSDDDITPLRAELDTDNDYSKTGSDKNDSKQRKGCEDGL